MRRKRWRSIALGAAVLVLPGLTGGPAASADPGSTGLGPAADARVSEALAAVGEIDSAAGHEAAVRSTRSPFIARDPVGDARPYHPRGDLVLHRTSNRNVVNVQFWLRQRPTTWNTANTFAIIRLDGARNGRGPDYDVIVVSTRRTGKFAVVGPAHFDDPSEVLCVSRNVQDLGQSFVGYGYSVKLGRGCLGGRQGFSSRTQFVYAWWRGDAIPTIDVFPNRTFTPTVRPA